MLKNSVKSIKGIGDYYARVLINNGIKTCADLLWLFPKSRSKIMVQDHISQTPELVAMNLTIESVSVKSTTKKMTLIKGFNPHSQPIHIIFFSHSKLFYRGSKICVMGEAKFEYGKYCMTHPKWMPGHHTEFSENSYSVENIPPAIIKKSIVNILDQLKFDHDWIPQNILSQNSWENVIDSFKTIQTSDSPVAIEKAKERLRFEEALSYLIGIKIASKSKKSNNYKLDDVDLNDVFLKIGFSLTECQNKAWESIKQDLLSEKQMLRILYGDVGSGKTLVAIFALILCYRSKKQGVFLVPTEILAKQHYELMCKLFPEEKDNIILLTGNTKSKKIYSKIKDEVCIIIGTHAVLQNKVEYNSLGLLVIDEQHRFGVMQRMAIDQNLCYNVLLMTATPIPRTLQLSLNNAIDVSQILSRPQKHRNIDIQLNYKLESVIDQIKQFLEAGHNIFWVCPLIEKSETRNMMDVTNRAEYLKSIFGDMVGIVHGRLKYTDKESALLKFYNKETRILVSTTVIEVGINIPHANMIVIENPEVFGLAQLYQLVGRVGRGIHAGLCVLYHGFISSEAKQRLYALQKSKSGLELAEHDMYLRGTGNILGIEQSGENYFHLLDLAKDYEVLLQAEPLAEELSKSQSTDLEFMMDICSYLYSPWSGG